MNRATAATVLAAFTAAVLAAGCGAVPAGPDPDPATSAPASGVVAFKTETGGGDQPTVYRLFIVGGDPGGIEVAKRVYDQCTLGEKYDTCKKGGQS